jgi:membrane protease YdiL (CAAX protease family)
MVKPSLKTRLGIELIALAILTTIFLVLFPRRPIFVDESLALFALLLLAVNVKFTRNVVWAQFPPPASKRYRLRKCLRLVMTMTFSWVLVLLAVGIAIGYSQSGWETAFNRVCNWRILIAICLYFPWGLVQQTLFQFYLLGRLRTLLPSSTAIICTGLAFALVHLPDLWVTLATAVTGLFWTYLYYRYRLLTPIALSQAILGATFYSWIYGEDLAKTWTELLI